jgi:hypothetical protein
MTDTLLAQQCGQCRNGLGRAVDSQLLARSTFFCRTGRRLQDSDELLFFDGLYRTCWENYQREKQDKIQRMVFHKIPLL